MTNPILNWWRSQKFKTALKQGNYQKAKKLLADIQQSRSKLSWLEQLFKKQLEFEQLLRKKNREIIQLNEKFKANNEQIERLESLELQQYFGEFEQPDKPEQNLLAPEPKFFEFVAKSFEIVEHDSAMLECTGIDDRVFEDFEANLAEFIQEELRISSRKTDFAESLEKAIQDLQGLKNGQDPQYSFELSPHIYLMKYFLDNVYCAYLAWFLIYQAGLLPTKVNILDIAAGPGTMIYGLALLLQSSRGFFPIPPMHISYYSLEQHKSFQYRGLQFWRQYVEPRGTNAYFRFDTSNLFEPQKILNQIPKQFFDFIIISHCFFADETTRSQSCRIFNEIFKKGLKPSGYVLLIIQEKKLFIPYNIRQSENQDQELTVVTRFTQEMGLTLVWYKYLTSRHKRSPISSAEFIKLAREKLPKQPYMTPLMQHYFQQKHESNYVLDDYIILAKR